MVERESESLGKALVASDLGFSSEAISNGVNGYKVSVEEIDSFINAINILWKNPEKCRKLGKNARKDYETKYRPEDNYKQLITIYRSLK